MTTTQSPLQKAKLLEKRLKLFLYGEPGAGKILAKLLDQFHSVEIANQWITSAAERLQFRDVSSANPTATVIRRSVNDDAGIAKSWLILRVTNRIGYRASIFDSKVLVAHSILHSCVIRLAPREMVRTVVVAITHHPSKRAVALRLSQFGYTSEYIPTSTCTQPTPRASFPLG